MSKERSIILKVYALSKAIGIGGIWIGAGLSTLNLDPQVSVFAYACATITSIFVWIYNWIK